MRTATYSDLYLEAISRGHWFASRFLERAISLSRNSTRPLKLTAEQMQDAHEMLALIAAHAGERYREATQEDFDRWGISESVTGVLA